MFEYILGIPFALKAWAVKATTVCVSGSPGGVVDHRLIYTANVFLTLEQRTSAPHVYTYSAH